MITQASKDNEQPSWDARSIQCISCGNYYDTEGNALGCVAQVQGLWDEDAWAIALSKYLCNRSACQAQQQPVEIIDPSPVDPAVLAIPA